MHESRDADGALTGVEFYEAERCYRVTRAVDGTGAEWRVTVDGHPHALGFPASPADTAAEIRRRTLQRVDEHGG